MARALLYTEAEEVPDTLNIRAQTHSKSSQSASTAISRQPSQEPTQCDIFTLDTADADFDGNRSEHGTTGECSGHVAKRRRCSPSQSRCDVKFVERKHDGTTVIGEDHVRKNAVIHFLDHICDC